MANQDEQISESLKRSWGEKLFPSKGGFSDCAIGLSICIPIVVSLVLLLICIVSNRKLFPWSQGSNQASEFFLIFAVSHIPAIILYVLPLIQAYRSKRIDVSARLAFFLSAFVLYVITLAIPAFLTASWNKGDHYLFRPVAYMNTYETIKDKTIKGGQKKQAIPWFIAASFLFAGWAAFCVLDMLKHFVLEGLRPSLFLSYIGRIFFVMLLAIPLGFFMMETSNALNLLVLFFIPFFPREIMSWGRKLLLSFTGNKGNPSRLKPLPKDQDLYSIRGMNEYFISRFEELEITNVQNLATIKLSESFIESEFGLHAPVVIEMIAQAEGKYKK